MMKFTDARFQEELGIHPLPGKAEILTWIDDSPGPEFTHKDSSDSGQENERFGPTCTSEKIISFDATTSLLDFDGPSNNDFFLVPFAESIRERTQQELFLQKIIMEGVIAIESEMKPRVLERKLKSFLTPSSRKSRLVSLRKIQEKFNIQAESNALPLLPKTSVKQFQS